MISAREVDANYAAERLRRAEAAARGAVSAEIVMAAAADALDPDTVPDALVGLSEAEALDREASLEGRAPWWRRLWVCIRDAGL